MVKKTKIASSKAKRKTAVARARIKKGIGKVAINSKPIGTYKNEFAKNEMNVPFTIGEEILGKGFEETLDVNVNVRGGGYMSRAEAVKTAIAKALVEWSGSDELKNAYLHYDRNLLVDDVRRKESKKPMGRGARKKRQKSYR